MKFSEQSWIDYIEKLFLSQNRNVLCGIGDDAAVLRVGNRKLLLTTDSLQENIHFKWKNTSPFLLGRKTLAVNLSDIAAMGGKPSWALLSMAFPRHEKKQRVFGFLQGLQSIAKEFGVSIVGGDTDHSKKDWRITLALLGEVENPVYRSGAKVGDDLWVTGFLGTAPQDPVPRIQAGRLLSQKKLAHAMIDISDGFLLDLEHLCEASSCGAEVLASALPVGKKSLSFALSRGEDYELLFSASPQKRKKLQELFRKIKTPFHRVGVIVSGRKVRVLDETRKEIFFKYKGYSHF